MSDVKFAEWDRDEPIVHEWICDPPPDGRLFAVVVCEWIEGDRSGGNEYPGAIAVHRIHEITLAPERPR
jgi:hypothetical protein